LIARSDVSDYTGALVTPVKDDEEIETYGVPADLKTMVEYQALGKVRTDDGLKDLMRFLDKEWNKSELSWSTKLAYKRAATVIYYTIPVEEQRMQRYIAGDETRELLAELEELRQVRVNSQMRSWWNPRRYLWD